VAPADAIQEETSPGAPLPDVPLFPEPTELVRPAYQLYSPGAVALAAFLGGPMGGFLVLLTNYWSLRRWAALWATVALGLLGNAALLAMLLRVPEHSPAWCVSVPLILVMYLAAKGLQGSLYEKHLQQGGLSASLWKAAGLGLVGALLFFGLAIGGAFTFETIFSDEWSQKLVFGPGEEVYYTRDVTEAEARRLGQFLQEDGYFAGRGPSSVQLSRETDRIVVSFVVKRNAWKDPQIVAGFREIGQDISTRLYGGRLVEVRLCDEELTVQKKVN
jgi:hypothetical protein